MRRILLAVLLALVGASLAALAEAGGFDLQGLPANKWVALQTEGKATGADYSLPVYVPSRRQVLHWGGVLARYRTKATPRARGKAALARPGGWAVTAADWSSMVSPVWTRL